MDERFYFNGINGSNGEYLLQPLQASAVAAIAKGEPLDPRQLSELRHWHERVTRETLGPVAGVDPTKIEEAGWGVIFAHDADPRVRESISELLTFRQEQATKNGDFYREYTGADGYRPGESKRDFLARHGVGPGPADPHRVPYYLLIVGDPNSIPFRFQYQLDVQYAVGRLWFDGADPSAQYAQYARSVLAAENGEVRLSRRASFFGVQNANDRATKLSATELVTPLAQEMPACLDAAQPPWEVEKVIADDANKARLSRLLGGDETPSLLFSASHGMGFNKGDARQLRHQGSILCQDWPGPVAWRREIPEDHYFSADDVADDANLLGLISFHFACYGAGTPQIDDFAHQAFRDPVEIAPHGFVSRLPQRLLGHPNGGALAVIGHVERAWGYSFMWNRAGRQLQCFKSTLQQLMSGWPVGAAMEFFNDRYAELSTDLSATLEDIKFGRTVDDYEVAGMWTANNDARSYVILGDPAARLPLVSDPDQAARPLLDRVTFTTQPPSGDNGGGGGNDGGDDNDGAANDGAANDGAANDGAANDDGSPVATADRGGADLDLASGIDDDATPFFKQIAATEKRFAESRMKGVVAYNAPPNGPAFLRKNDLARVRQRLSHLGLPFDVIDQVTRAGVSYAKMPSPDDAPQSADVTLERILGRNEMVDAHFLEAGSRASQSVGRIRICSASGRTMGWGTGSLIGPRLLLTNNHVLGTNEQASSSRVEFRVESRPEGDPTSPASFSLQPNEFFLTDALLDFSIVAVAPQNEEGETLDQFGWNAPHLVDDPILVEEFVNIVQHPGGRPKQVALRDNQVSDLLDRFVHYRTDTEPGSSGAPVFNDQWEMVALHHSGVPRRDADGNILSRDGRLWRPEMGDQLIDWIANEGVRMSSILTFVSEAPMEGNSESLRAALLEASAHQTTVSPVLQNPVRSKPVQPTPVPPADLASTTTAGVLHSATANGVTLTVPLVVSVSIGPPRTDAENDASIHPTLTPEPRRPDDATAADVEVGEAVSIDPDYGYRCGYDPEFLGCGSLAAPLPKLSAAIKRDAAQLRQVAPGENRFELKYHHYSVVMNRHRRLALLTAVNIDGGKTRSITRESDKWFFDPRIAREHQVDNELYQDNPFDRGHLVRRLDPAWGRTQKIAKVANDDTFHWTNCSPQHQGFNRGKNIWQGLENYLLERADDANQKMTVFTGPVFRDDDPDYRGIQIPIEYWKVAVLEHRGKLASIAFLVSQEDLMRPALEEGAIDVARTFQISVSQVEHLTGLDFGNLRNVDVERIDDFAAENRRRRELNEFDDIRASQSSMDRSADELAFGSGVSSASPEPVTERVAGSDLRYYLLSYDAQNRERTDHPAGKISEKVFDALDSQTLTDVFLFSHGWMGDVPAAKEQYQGWLGAMAKCEDDIDRIRLARPGFRPLLIGLHWPSLPWGDERLGQMPSFESPAGREVAPTADSVDEIETLVAEYAERLGGGEAVRRLIRQILEASRDLGEPDELPQDVTDAYRALNDSIDLPMEGMTGVPGSDREEFDPQAIYQAFRNDVDEEAVSFGLFSRETLLSPLRTLSFWKMKDRARQFGEQAVHPLLCRLQSATNGRDVRFHLSGHSFGCIVASSAVAGPIGGGGPPRPVDSLVLLQGALSLWAFSSRIPNVPDNLPGYFHRIVSLGLVRGPIVTSQSRYDSAVGKWYPRAAWTAGQVAFAPGALPKYGAIGTFGIQGSGLAISNLSMHNGHDAYGFRTGRIYNVDGSRYINQGGGFSGAHSDIRKPEVAHCVWQALL